MSKIVIVTASNNKNLELAGEFEKFLKDQKLETQVINLVETDLPLYTPKAESTGIPESAKKYNDILDSASGFVFITPEYNGGIAPALTSFIAWISRSGADDWRKSFNAKPTAIASFSGGGGFHALMALRTQLSYIGMNVIGRQVRATFKEELNPSDIEAVGSLLVKSVTS